MYISDASSVAWLGVHAAQRCDLNSKSVFQQRHIFLFAPALFFWQDASAYRGIIRLKSENTTTTRAFVYAVPHFPDSFDWLTGARSETLRGVHCANLVVFRSVREATDETEPLGAHCSGSSEPRCTRSHRSTSDCVYLFTGYVRRSPKLSRSRHVNSNHNATLFTLPPM